jgi:GNAT superfamily N-acetyltransferase
MRIVDGRPFLADELGELLASSIRENVANVSKLVQQWKDGSVRFEGEGEALNVAMIHRKIIGVGGLVRCRDVPGASRVTRFYVLPEFRNKGVATAIALPLLHNAFQYVDLVTCNAQASEGAAPFWESLGFIHVDLPGVTHTLSVGATVRNS